MLNFLKDLQFGVRALRRMPGSALISVVVLGLGIGLCSFMFSVIYGVFFRGLDIPDSSRVFVVMETRADQDEFNRPVPLRDFAAMRERQTAFTGLLGVSGAEITLSTAEGAWRLEAAAATANTFELMG